MTLSASEPPRSTRSTRAVLAALVAVALVVGTAGALAGSASAGDTAGALSVTPDEFEVEPGDTVSFEVAMVNDGERGDDGVYGVTLRLDYPAEYLTVTAIEPGDWFREAVDGRTGGESRDRIEVRESVDYDDEHGAARLVQTLENPTTGVTGEAVVATVTVRVDPDAGPAVAELGTRKTSTDLTSRREYPQPLATPTVSFNVSDGGDGEVVTPTYDEEAFAGDGDSDAGDSGTDETAGDAGAGTDDTEDDTSGAESDDETPTPVTAAIFALVVAGLLLAKR